MAMVLQIKRLELLIAAVLLLPASWLAAAKPGPVNDAKSVESITDDVKKAELSRQESMRMADAATRKGNDLLKKKDYQNAIDQYLEAIKYLNLCSEASDDIRDNIASCKRMVAKTYEYWSRDLYMQAQDSLRAQDINTAIALCEKASEIYPPSKAQNDALIADYNKTKEDRKSVV